MPADKRADHPGTSTAAASDAGLAPAVDSLTDSRPTLSANGHDFLVGGITLAAILLMVGSGTSWLRSTLGSSDMAGASHQAISATLLLNIALIMFGWRRFRELRAEVARRTAAEERAQALAWHDPLTGFLNRRALSDQAPERIAGWRAQGKSIGALVIDVDAFKSVNDLFGHAGGDTVLQTIAVRMAAIAPAGSMLARLGGDELRRRHFAKRLGCPARKHLVADRLAGREVDQRLVNRKQRTRRNRHAQFAFDGVALGEIAFHDRIEAAVAASTQALGLIHRGIGVAQQRLE